MLTLRERASIGLDRNNKIALSLYIFPNEQCQRLELFLAQNIRLDFEKYSPAASNDEHNLIPKTKLSFGFTSSQINNEGDQKTKKIVLILLCQILFTNLWRYIYLWSKKSKQNKNNESFFSSLLLF